MGNTAMQEKNDYYEMEDVCIYCGRPVPEGIMVCPICKKEYFGKEIEDNE